jgi:hypothetical protein
LCTVTITTLATTKFLLIELNNSVAGNISDAWFDINSMTLEEVVTDTTFTGKVAEKVRPVLQAVTSTDNIDQSLDTGGAYANTYALTAAVDEGATHKQTFTPTKKYTTQIAIWPIDNGTGDWSLIVHTAANYQVAKYTIVNASVTEGAFLYFDVPNIWASGALHFHVISTVADGTLKANTSNDLETASYIQRYAKRTEDFTLICNGVKTQLKTDKDGLMPNSVIDLDNGKYWYDSGSLYVAANALPFCNSAFSATGGGNETNVGMILYGVNGWGISTSNACVTGGGSNCAIIFKVNTILPAKKITFTYGVKATNSFEAFTVYYSFDNVTYTQADVGVNLGTGMVKRKFVIDNPNTNIIYLKMDNQSLGSNKYLSIGQIHIDADLDTSKIPSGLFYPLSTNQFTETVKLPAVATRVYFQSAKYTNEYGVVVPALEFTDGSGVLIGYTPLKLDNSQETNPCVSILSTTTNYQQSGTGSAVTGGYVLNSGEYITFTGTVAEIKIDYQVGGGTTAIAAITKNTLFLSSNGESADSTQDPSHQMNAIVGVRQQGLLSRVGDLGEEIAKVRDGVVKSSLWTEWIPTLTWTTGTPEGSVVTKARYKIVDGVCSFTFYYSATDANAATALTISLPVLPKDNDSLTALQAQELADTTWSNPNAYIDDGGTTIVFRSFSTIADTKAVKVLVSGSYEV